MSIPKIIHYVWVGKNKKPYKIKKCMKTWKKYLKDYKIIEWCEDNFDMNSHPFLLEAYNKKKWAFVSDYIRAYVIYHEGGVYFDTDVIMVDYIDELLENKAFVGFESENYPFTAVFGAEKGHPFVHKMLDYYNRADFKFNFENNNTISVSNILIESYNCALGDKEQILSDDIKVYRSDILCNPSLKSKTIHAFTATWLDKKKIGWKLKITKFLRANATNRFKVRLYILVLKFIRILKV